jgi:hypothetical protein
LKPLSFEQVAKLSPERVLIARVFKKHIDQAVAELGAGYDVTFQGSFDKTPIKLEIEITASQGEIP